jgi:hypothetical protein
MARVNLYGQNQHVVLVDGVPLNGFAEGDFLQVKLDGNAAVRTHGGDGPSMNLSTAQGGQVTIGLLPTSPSIGPLYAVRDSQANNPRLFSVQVISGVEEIMIFTGCAFGDTPQFQTGGPTMQPRQFVIEFLTGVMDTSVASPVTSGLLGGLI